MTRLAIFADIHMRDGQVAPITDELNAVCDTLEARSFDHAFVLGDLIEDGDSKAVDEANVERIYHLFEERSFPITYLLGNHDVERLTRERLSELLNQERFHGVVETDRMPVIFLDSTKEQTAGARGELGTSQRNWLADVMSEHKRPLVFCHHPLGNFEISDNEWFKDYPERAFLSDRKETLDVIEENGPAHGTISGHIHQTGFTKFRGMAHVSISAFSKELPNIPLTGTYAEVNLDDHVSVSVRTRDDKRTSYTFL